MGKYDDIMINNMKILYPEGTRVELVRMDDPQAPPKGTKGTVIGVDDTGSVMVKWDNGSSLSVLLGVDYCEKIKERK